VTVTSIVTSIVTVIPTTTTRRPTTTEPATATTRRPRPATTQPPAQNCDPSYPDFCIPPPPPDLDCADVNGSNFTVLPPDPHRFDREGDGVGCES
jgi:micrococcal nuclease